MAPFRNAKMSIILLLGRGNTDFIARGIEVDWVVDNAGFEFLTDMILAYFLKEMSKSQACKR